VYGFGSDVWKQREGVGVFVIGIGSWEWRYQVGDFATASLAHIKLSDRRWNSVAAVGWKRRLTLA